MRDVIEGGHFAAEVVDDVEVWLQRDFRAERDRRFGDRPGRLTHAANLTPRGETTPPPLTGEPRGTTTDPKSGLRWPLGLLHNPPEGSCNGQRLARTLF